MGLHHKVAFGLWAALAAGTASAQVVETPDSMVGELHTAFGEHHARAVHAKGIILEG